MSPVGYPFDSGDHNILWLAIGGPRKGLPIAPRFQACDGHGACVILDRPETQPRGPIACRPASGAPGCILGAVCWRPWIDQTTTPRGYLSQVDTPLSPFAPNRNVPSGSGWWSAPSPSRLMMATPRDPSRVREAKPYGPALDCSLAVAKTALCSTRRRGSRAYGKRGHLYWATEGDISIELRQLGESWVLKPNDNVPMSAQ